MPKNKKSTIYVLKIAILLSLVCSLLVSIAAIGLKPIQEANAAKERKLNILRAAGIYNEGDSIDDLYNNNIVAVAIDLKTGNTTDAIDTKTFNAVKAAKDPKIGRLLRSENDPAKINSISKYAVIYQLRDNNKIRRVILPIRGYGLWGTMFGFLAMDDRGKTIEGLTFYDQKETPGLGAEIMNPNWQAKWVGKKPFDKNNNPDIKLVKTLSTKPDILKSQVDSLAGATLTSRGVQSTINFWLSDKGYGPYLKKLGQ